MALSLGLVGTANVNQSKIYLNCGPLFWGCPQVELQIACLLVIRSENNEQDRFVP